MKHRNFLLCAVVFFFLIQNVYSQPVLTRDDIPTAIGTQYQMVTEGAPAASIPINLGSPGGPQTWDFSGVTLTQPTSAGWKIVDLNSTGHASQFPNANLVISPLNDDLNGLYSFYQITDDYFKSLGSVFQQNMITTYQTNDPDLNFPVELNDAWTTHKVGTVVMGTFTNNISITTESLYDAWGTITIPSGFTFNDCARFRQIQAITVGGYTSYSVTYGWYKADIFFPVFAIAKNFTTYPANPYFTVGEGCTYFTGGSIGIEDDNLLLQSMTLRNYPNPFSSHTTFEFALSRGSSVNLTIYDIAGRLIKTIINDVDYERGTFHQAWDARDENANNVASGIYFYRLKTEAGIQTNKMILIE